MTFSISLFFLSLYVLATASLPNSPSLWERVDAPLRDVYVSIAVDLSYLRDEQKQIPTYDPQKFATIATHPTIDIVGDGISNGNFRTELSLGDHGLCCVARDYGLHNSMEAPESRFNSKSFIRSVKVGSIRINNRDLMDFETGKGIVTDLWARNPEYRLISRNCIDYVHELLEELRIDPGDDFGRFYSFHRSEIERYGQNLQNDFAAANRPVKAIQHNVPSNPKESELWLYDVSDGSKPMVILHEPPEVPANAPITDFGPGNEFTGTKDGVEQKIRSVSDMQNFFAGRELPEDIITFTEQAQAPEIESNPLFGEGTPSSAATEGEYGRGVLKVEGPAELAVVRSRGTVYTIASIAKTSLVEVAGVASTAILPVFIILDLINGDWKAAVLGAVAGVAGIAAAFLGSGPIGLLVGAAIGLFFSIFPGLFHEKAPPKTNNPAKIIQFAFFGDPDHTGNEACNKQRAQAHQEQNCTALYGTGTLSKILNLSIFDIIVLLMTTNGGRPLSIIDMSFHFPVKDYTKPNWTFNQPTYIDCGRAPPPQPLPGYGGQSIPGYHVDLAPASGYDCPKPKFYLNRTLITLNALNSTADKIYDRIIPAPGGDCNLLSDPTDGQDVPFVNVKYTGQPVGIECNLTLDGTVGLDPTLNLYSTNPDSHLNVTTYSPGTVLVYNPITNASSNHTLPGSKTAIPNNSSTVSSAPPPLKTQHTVSTDNSTIRGYRTPPPPTSFLAYNSSNSMCFTKPDASLCLPNGTYETGNGDLGFLIRTSTGLSLNAGGALRFSYPASYDQAEHGNPYAASAGDELYNSSVSFFETVTGGSPRQAEFKQKISWLAASDKVFDASVPHSPPGICLFTQKQYKGDVACYGLGATNLTDPIGTKVKSVNFKGGANVWIYSGKYGDLTGKFLNTDVADMEQVPDGSVFNFAGRVKAMWVSIPV